MLLMTGAAYWLLWKLAVALIVQMVAEVAILIQDVVEVVQESDIKIGFAT
jgi:hypothetical protein